MQKYRADRAEPQADGSTPWFAEWMGGPSLSTILDNLVGDMRRTVYITGEADTYFSIPAVCKLAGCRMRGYVTGDSAGNYVFRHCYTTA
jgi:hypothetical protein